MIKGVKEDIAAEKWEMTCDLCPETAKSTTTGVAWNNDDLRTQTRLSITEFLLKDMKEGGTRQVNEIRYDICPKCFKEKILPYIEKIKNDT